MASPPSHPPFRLVIPVEAADIDELGHVNNVVYLRWVQEAASSHWRAMASAETQAAIVWVVLRHEIDYKSPAQLGEEVLIQTWVGTATGLSFERHTEILRATDQQLLAQARTLWCPINTQTGRPQRINAALRAQFSIEEPELS
ncbi:thioesterase [Leptolyngbya sp. 'hensonii']|uniref:acyl-CoA thioesterase n=1 Tax=Leptolyngbya sp. 'hensonii' TaxID=1922337 RepID=UPI00094F6EA7|nr:thioesterase family protein [Leptolyngbya sp. 'hensonii']OLP17465.1 thioesterase [Leptolyngbya sp. 'hensonii']